MKLQKLNNRKIDLSQINVTENIRKHYKDIESLARSIERDGLLEPIGLIEQEDGTFNILYGFRRYHAFKLLVDEGKPFNQINAIITKGDRIVIQLIENIHRSDLDPSDFEDALQALIDTGLTQKEISERLNIRITRISDALAARKERLKLEDSGVDTTGMSTSALSGLRQVPEEKKAEVAKKAKKKGGTVKAVKEEVKKVKQENNIKQEIEIITETNKEDEIYDTAYTFIDFTDFIKLPEIKKIIDDNKYVLQWKCKHCGEEIR